MYKKRVKIKDNTLVIFFYFAFGKSSQDELIPTSITIIDLTILSILKGLSFENSKVHSLSVP